MKREWTPGDVAMRVSEVGGTKFVALRVAQCPGASLGHLHHWHFICPGISKTQCGSDNHYLAEYRPLVVIDPEDREQVERLCGAMKANGWGGIDDEAPSDMQTVLRSLITPLKPEEPTGLGAVVECIYDNHYVRVGAIDAPWRHVNGNGYSEWDDLAVVKILSEGVTQ